MPSMQPTRENVQGRLTEHRNGAPSASFTASPFTTPLGPLRASGPVQGRCLAWEMLGYGTSIQQGATKNLSLSAQAGYLLAWIGSLELDRKPVLIGHDLGGESNKWQRCRSRVLSPA